MTHGLVCRGHGSADEPQAMHGLSDICELHNYRPRDGRRGQLNMRLNMFKEAGAFVVAVTGTALGHNLAIRTAESGA